MIKVFYWAPFISKIATPKAVINSALSLNKYSNKKIQSSIINLFGEWNFFLDDKKKYNLNLLNLFNKIHFLNLPDNGFFLSMISFVFIFLKSFFPLLKLLKKKKPNYLIIHLNTSLPLFLLIFFNFNTKFILRISGKPRLNFLRTMLWKIASKKLYKITAPTKLIYEDLLERKIFIKEKLHILYDPVIVLDKFKKINTMPTNYGKYLVAAGRLTKQKNFKFLINCFENINKKYDNFKLIILGDGDQKEMLSMMIKEKHLEKKVFLLGYKKNILEYLRKSYCFILSSLWEDPGFVLIESAMTNTIILSSNCDSGPKDFLKDGINSFVYESNNEKSFLDTFDNFLNTEKAERYKMKISMKRTIKKFTMFNHYKNLKKIIL